MIPPILGVIGAADASPAEYETARKVGTLAAGRGWTLVCGGLTGVMEAASRGANESNGTVVGILPGASREDANKFVTIPISTNMGHARNVIIAHTAEILIAIGGSTGTLSEIAIARKLGKPVFVIGSWEIADTIPTKDAKTAIEECQRHLDRIYST
ncbi:MAG: TIGR00725 family protein [Deltaproteobacteria bacterium]|jgi:uncharacterized protein (TIGR00725 family)|nr:TIGR00725 family protein [Deltaproteobacteria bacterium]